MNATPHNQNGLALQVRGVRKSFAGVEVLKGLDFEVRPGEIFVIMGPSGSGKSTLTKLLSRLYAPGSGRVLIDNYAQRTALRLGVISDAVRLEFRKAAGSAARPQPAAAETSVARRRNQAARRQKISKRRLRRVPT